VLQVSDRALAIIDEVRGLSGAGEGEAIVLFREAGGGLGFTIGAPTEGDQVIARDGRPIVAVAADLAVPFDGCVLDFVANANRGSFTLRRP
jgi:hypothetical protein